MTMRCVVCDTKFNGIRQNAWTCSAQCKVVRQRVLSRERYDKNREEFLKRSQEQYYDNVRRQFKVRPCVVCGAKFETRWRAKTCSKPCRAEFEKRYIHDYYLKNRKAIRERRRKTLVPKNGGEAKP